MGRSILFPFSSHLISETDPLGNTKYFGYNKNSEIREKLLQRFSKPFQKVNLRNSLFWKILKKDV